MYEVRKLQAGEAEAVRAFLEARAESSMFLLSNIAAAGIGNPNLRYGGDYWGAFDGRLVGVLGHFWNHNVILQVPDAAARVALFAEVRKSLTRPVAGILGPDDQVADGLSRLALSDADFAADLREQLFALPATALLMPAPKGTVSVYHWKEGDPALMRRWLRDYNLETLGAEPGEKLDQEMAAAVAMAAGLDRWVLEVNGAPVALAGFNARVDRLVQVGPVWTPPENRGRGYARLLLALILEKAFAEGATKAVLFTSNPAGDRAYRAVGFEPCGDYRLAILKAPVSLH
ncbi:GNAT family N-acetyltransferase [Martelella endophytica]|uniref:N-acetyltransferase domain-containing protein n=1 Tax=Martelella endophytica TaxID=1486262 RepID=A0A0D5LU17_MAREN|nr:GNAT family N-acetyltransferase [Martelella endophytica]AJY47724.1 hypothetical protein TM49_21880 [Martelella endophytica]